MIGDVEAAVVAYCTQGGDWVMVEASEATTGVNECRVARAATKKRRGNMVSNGELGNG